MDFLNFFEGKTYLAYHPKLNQKIFDGENLRPEVRESLMKISHEWQKFSRIPDDFVSDIIFTGGNANYNYTKYSDIDLHIVVDKTKLSADKAFLDDYLKDKKTLWAAQHHITVKGYSVEMYAQDTDDNLVASGVYSVLGDHWLYKPVHGHYNFATDEALVNKIAEWKDIIERMIDTNAPSEEFKTVKEKLKAMRAAGLESGEFGFDNLLFKGIRNSKSLDKMNTYLSKREDRELSLENFN